MSLRTYQSVLTPQRTDKGPVERSRLHFLLAWLHAVILERLRYTPTGWTKTYEFNEADQRCALDLIDELVDSFGDRNNLPPEKIPWDAIRTIICQTLYGGKIDNDFDAKILSSLAEQFFTSKCFDQQFPLFYSSNPSDTLTIPEGTKSSHYVEWVNKLPSVESPAWAGLPVSVERVLREKQSEYLIGRIWQIQDVNEEAVSLESTSEKKAIGKKEGGQQQVKWLRNLGEKAVRYLQILPSSIEKLNRTSNSISNPLFRFLEREVTVATKLLDTLRSNLGEIKLLCEGKAQSTSLTRKLAQEIHAEQVPSVWKKYRVANLTVTDWVTDFKKRLDQFNEIIPKKDYQKAGVWMGGLLFPEAYLTATRQAVAQSHQWSLEELELRVTIYENEEVEEDSFLISGLFIEGADWNRSSKQITLVDEMRFALPTIKFTWTRVEKANKGNVPSDEILVPVYLNKSRAHLLFSVKIKCGDIAKTTLYQKGLALIACEN